ncbi:MAG: hypothetical protein AAF547_18495 [Actinomycetota bacterium]
MSKEDAQAMMAEIRRRHDAAFEQAKAEGLAAGQEPFDLDRFLAIFNTVKPPSPLSREEQIEEWEHAYYRRTQRCMTIEEFARAMEEAEMYDGG